MSNIKEAAAPVRTPRQRAARLKRLAYVIALIDNQDSPWSEEDRDALRAARAEQAELMKQEPANNG